jgi:hypothetical protein
MLRFSRAVKATVRHDEILEEGFNPKYFANYWKNKKGDVHHFFYEYGFLKRIENDKLKYNFIGMVGLLILLITYNLSPIF